MYGSAGPPGNQGKAPVGSWALRSLAREAARSAAAISGSRTARSTPDPAGSSGSPRAAVNQGDSSRVILRFGSAPSNGSRGGLRGGGGGAGHGSGGVLGAESARPSLATAGKSRKTLPTMAEDRNRFRVCSVHS